jgi:hypothetical protein
MRPVDWFLLAIGVPCVAVYVYVMLVFLFVVF